ncbi:MAG TPA: aquaporin [Propionibacteriaceae bacterium]|nr:aquaporin [Propionibacteriaceae bacterium]
MSLLRKCVAEAVGTAFLVAAVIGSGIAAQRLSPGQLGLQLLESSLATGAVLMALVVSLQPVSAAFNPVVTMIERALGQLTTRQTAALIGAQLAGGLAGTASANLMFDLPPVTLATHTRHGAGVWLAEVIATLGLVLIIAGASHGRSSRHVGYLVGAYITGAYWFTSSTSFANPAVTLARTLSDTFAGIAPSSAPAFIAMQLAGGAVALAVIKILYPPPGIRAPASPSVHKASP